MALGSEKLDGGVGVITLDEPELRNALTAEARGQLREALAGHAADPDIDALVITGAGGHFCAGGDIRTMGETDTAVIDARMGDVAKTAEMVAAFPKPVICAVAGHAAGAGISLACLADIVIAEESAQFTFSFLRIGLGPDWGLSFTLPRRVGATTAKRLIVTGASLDAEEAHKYGLVDTVTLPGEALETALGAARELVDGPKESIAAIKGMLSDMEGLHQALALEADMQRQRFPAPDHQEGAAAFREKRKPDYTKGGA